MSKKGLGFDPKVQPQKQRKRQQVVDLNAVGAEQNLALGINAEKQPGFAQALNSVGAASVIRVTDSQESQPQPPAAPTQQDPAPSPVPVVDNSSDPEPPVEVNQPGTFDMSRFESMVQNAVQAASAPIVTELQNTRTELNEVRGQLQTAQAEAQQAQAQAEQSQVQLTEAQQRAAQAQQQAQANERLVQGLGTLQGQPVVQAPNVNLHTRVDDSPKGDADRLVSLLSAGGNTVYNRQYNTTAVQRNGGDIRRYIQGCLTEARHSKGGWKSAPLFTEVESWIKGAGLLSGGVQNAVSGPSTGEAGKTPNLYLDVLSALMRETHNFHNIFWQFTRTVYDPSSAPSKNILVPRVVYLDDPETIDDYIGADFDTYRSVGAVVGSDTDSQSQVINDIPIGIIEYRLGRSNKVATRPVYIPEFHQATALLDLLSVLNMQLGQNYYRFEEKLIREQYESSTIVRYNDNGETTDDPADVGAGDGGTVTTDFMDSLYTEMYAAGTPSMPNGNYCAVLNPTSLNQYKKSLGDQYEAPTVEQLMDLTNMLTAATGVEIGRASGYVGAYNGFEIFASNSFGKGVAGASPTANSVTFGGGTRDTYDSFAFGPGAVGHGVALPMEIRASGVTPFQVGESYIWLSREGVGALDIDSALGSGQQDRVWKMRTAKTPL